MNNREKGFLLLTCRLGDPDRHPLTVAQFRELERCVRRAEKPSDNKDLQPEDLIAIGCAENTAQKVVSLLADQMLLSSYVDRGCEKGCIPLSRVSYGYPSKLIKCLGEEAPGCIWYKGDCSILGRPAISLVGSRELKKENADFARRVGRLAAQNGLTLISGNARGADTIAQQSCLEAGGAVISIVADALMDKTEHERILYISEEGYDLPFYVQRALSRNRLIHSMGEATFVAQCSNGTGGTWDGACRNLRGNWSTVYCCPDGSVAVARLYQLGAKLVKTPEIEMLIQKIACEIV